MSLYRYIEGRRFNRKQVRSDANEKLRGALRGLLSDQVLLARTGRPYQGLVGKPTPMGTRSRQDFCTLFARSQISDFR